MVYYKSKVVGIFTQEQLGDAMDKIRLGFGHNKVAELDYKQDDGSYFYDMMMKKIVIFIRVIMNWVN